MTSSYGEIRYEDEDMAEACQVVGRLLKVHGRASFKVAAFGTLHSMSAIDSDRLLLEGDQPLWFGPYGVPNGILDPLTSKQTLWIRETGSNVHTAAWFQQSNEHVPEYVAEKFNDGNAVDGYGLAVALLLIEGARVDAPLSDLEEKINHWHAHFTAVHGRQEDLPAFMTAEAARVAKREEHNEGGEQHA